MDFFLLSHRSVPVDKSVYLLLIKHLDFLLLYRDYLKVILDNTIIKPFK